MAQVQSSGRPAVHENQNQAVKNAILPLLHGGTAGRAVLRCLRTRMLEWHNTRQTGATAADSRAAQRNTAQRNPSGSSTASAKQSAEQLKTAAAARSHQLSPHVWGSVLWELKKPGKLILGSEADAADTADGLHDRAEGEAGSGPSGHNNSDDAGASHGGAFQQRRRIISSGDSGNGDGTDDGDGGVNSSGAVAGGSGSGSGKESELLEAHLYKCRIVYDVPTVSQPVCTAARKRHTHVTR